MKSTKKDKIFNSFESTIIDDKMFYHGFFDQEEISTMQKEMKVLKDLGINVCQIEGVISGKSKSNLKDTMIMLEKPNGENIYAHNDNWIICNNPINEKVDEYIERKKKYSHGLRTLVNATDEQINKLLTDLFVLYRQGYIWDFSDESRLFYDQEKGFTYIPIGKVQKQKYENEVFVQGIFRLLYSSLPHLVVPVDKDFPMNLRLFNAAENKEHMDLIYDLQRKISAGLMMIGIPSNLISVATMQFLSREQMPIIDDDDILPYIKELTSKKVK